MKKYGKYSKDTQNILQNIEDYLTRRFGTVQSEWDLDLKLLADNLDLYKNCKESVEQNGIYDANTGKKNPLLTTMKDLQSTINKQVQHFGLSPYAAAKIKETEEDDSDLLKNIMGEND